MQASDLASLQVEETTRELDSKWNQLKPVFLVLFVGSMLAMTLVVGKLAVLAGAAPLAFLSVALLVSGGLLWLLSLAKGQAVTVRGRVLEYGLVVGLLFVLPNVVGFLAVRHVGAGFLSLTFLFPLLFTYFLALLLGIERYVFLQALGVLVGLGGGAFLALSKVSLGDAPLGWILLTMTGPIIIATGNLYRTMRWPAGVAPLFLASLMLVCAGLMVLPFAWLKEGMDGFINVFTGRRGVILLVQIAAFSLQYRFYFVLQKLGGPVYLSQIGPVAAVVGGVIATLWLGEALPPNIPLSALLVALGLYFFQRGKAKSTAASGKGQ